MAFASSSRKNVITLDRKLSSLAFQTRLSQTVASSLAGLMQLSNPTLRREESHWPL